MPGVPCKPVGFSRSKLIALMKERNLGGILLTSPENVFYTTGFPALPTAGNPILYTLRNRLPYYSYMDAHGEVTLLCWWFAAEGMQFGTSDVRGFDGMSSAADALRALMKERLPSHGTLGVESSCPYYVLELVREAVQAKTFIVVDDLLETLRLIKSPEEIALIKESTAIIEKTVSELFGVIHVGMSRLDLIQEAKSRLFRNGATGISHATFAFGGANPEIAIGERLEPGKLVTLDLGGVYNGYASDTRRYLYTGSIPPSLNDRYKTMVEIVDQVGKALVPGAKLSDIFQVSLDLYAQHHLEPRFTRAGHNMGLETEEVWISKEEHRRVQSGMVINIELYAMADTGDRIGNEETYVIGKSGPTRISALPREIRRIG